MGEIDTFSPLEALYSKQRGAGTIQCMRLDSEALGEGMRTEHSSVVAITASCVVAFIDTRAWSQFSASQTPGKGPLRGISPMQEYCNQLAQKLLQSIDSEYNVSVLIPRMNCPSVQAPVLSGTLAPPLLFSNSRRARAEKLSIFSRVWVNTSVRV